MTKTSVSFDLWRDPWIPVRTATGGDIQMGFGGLLEHAHDIVAVSFGSAPAESSLLRVLTALAARVTKLDEATDGPNGWKRRQKTVLKAGCFDPENIKNYFGKYPDRFDLWSPSRPWLQDPRLRAECDKAAGTGKLLVDRASGNNHAWFGHHQDAARQPVPVTEAIASMLIWLYYGASGKCSSRRIGGTKVSNALAGPLRSSMSYFPWGDTLFTTLVASTPFPKIETRAEQDLCPWELPDLPDPAATPTIQNGPCATLTAGARHAVLLAPDDTGKAVTDAWITVASRGRVEVGADPFVIYQQSQAGNQFQRYANADRALWRDLDALLLKKPGGTSNIQRPAVFTTACKVVTGLRVRALGFQQDGQAKDEQFVSATTPPVLDFAEDTDTGAALAPHIGDLRLAGETLGQRLDQAVKRAWAGYVNGKPGDCAWARTAAAAYWPQAETEFWRRFRTQDFTGAFDSFTRLAERIFDNVTDRCGASLRGQQAREYARVWLYGGPKTTKPKASTKKKA